MTLGEKLVKLRKENNYTQEELSEILGVSRQAISRWESDAAYPETDTLIHLGELYGCSMDYLLKNEIETPEKPAPETRAPKKPFDLRSFYFERKSKRTIGGVPLWHINIGLGRTAKGIFAIGLCAKGVVSVGLFSLGILSVGVFALGLLALGSVVLGLLAAGAISVGVIAFGAISIGFLAVGAIAIGEFSVGALSIGKYLAIGDKARAMIAIGKSKAVGTLYQAKAITDANRQEVIALLDQKVPVVFRWLKSIVKLFI
ncbi:MAG: helix-turn-helix domain-containing protein [Clostridiales bacterium]|nr:helix-turn-helix domain-containing protein [Clostridiales bacterium]